MVAPNIVAAVMELIMNSLDAGSSFVDVRIDLLRWNVQVLYWVQMPQLIACIICQMHVMFAGSRRW